MLLDFLRNLVCWYLLFRLSGMYVYIYIWRWDINGLSFPEASVAVRPEKNRKCIDVADGSIGSVESIESIGSIGSIGYIGYIVYTRKTPPVK